MFNSQMLDAAIGLVFVYFLLSLLCSVIIEMFTSLTKKRARMLKNGILSLLQDSKALDKLYEQPLFIGNSAPKNLLSTLREYFRLPSNKKVFPSYISSRSFVLSLLESLKQHPDVVKKLLKDKISSLDDKLKIEYLKNKLNRLPDHNTIKKELLKSLKTAEANPDEFFSVIETCYDKIVGQPDIFKEILKEKESQYTINTVLNTKNLVNSLSDDNAIKKALLPLLENAGDSLDNAIDNMEKWYDEAMDRVTGWYKRYSQAFALILAFVIALVLNADTFQIGKAIYRDQALRTSLVDMTEKAIVQPSSTEKKSSPGEQPKPVGASLSSGQEKPGKGKQGAEATSSPITSMKPKTKKDCTSTAANQSTESGRAAPGSESQSSNLENADLKNKVEEANKIFQQISSLNLPIGWPFTEKGRPDWAKIFGSKDEKGGTTVETPGLLSAVKLLGILLTALMVSLGSNFWFELLNKLLNMRNAGKKPSTKEEQDAQKK